MIQILDKPIGISSFLYYISHYLFVSLILTFKNYDERLWKTHTVSIFDAVIYDS